MLIFQRDDPHLVTAWKHSLESLPLWGPLAWEGHGRSRAATLPAPFFCNFISSACAWGRVTVRIPAPSFLFETAGACSLSDLKVPVGEELILLLSQVPSVAFKGWPEAAGEMARATCHAQACI